MEKWKKIKQYEYYYISNIGRVKSIKSTSTRILKQGNNRKYLDVKLCRDGKCHSHSVHRLVALYFIPNHNPKYEVNHKDGNCENNNIDNLEWVSKSDNILHAVHQLGTINPPYIKRKVNQYTLQGEYIKSWDYIKLATLELGIDNSSITKCCKGILKQTGGYKWGYA